MSDLECGIDTSATAFATDRAWNSVRSGDRQFDPRQLVDDAMLEADGIDSADGSNTAFAADLVVELLNEPRSVPSAD